MIYQILVFLVLLSQDVNELQGRWSMVYREAYGKVDTDSYELLIVKDKFIMKKGDKVIATGTAVINPLSSPKTIDLIGENGRILKGIYELRGDFYICAYSRDDMKRPTDFNRKDNRINIWRRE